MNVWLWVGFTTFVLFMLFLDLVVFHREAHAVKTKEAAVWVGVWVALAVLFNLGVYFWYGRVAALEFLTGYVIEESLSVDNMFVFILIFSYFGVKPEYQHRVLFWGILGALVMRLSFILAGTALLERFEWVIYVFGGFLLFTGFKMLTQREHEMDPGNNPLLRLVRRIFPIAIDYDGQKFFIRQGERLLVTPLLLVLVVIEFSDLVFAVDSIPAIFAVTRDPFIVFTSNVFAILGLRALYFLLAGVVGLFRYLKVGLAFVLAFVGLKMVITEFYKIPILLSLGVIVGILGASIAMSLLHPEPALRHDES